VQGSPRDEVPRIKVVLVLVLIAGGFGCSQPAGPLAVAFIPPDSQSSAFVRVTGLSSAEISAFKQANLSTDAWSRVLRVTVANAAPDAPAMAGRYFIAGNAVEFRPMFPFDPGREYRVTFDPAAMPAPRAGPTVTVTASLPAAAPTPPTRVVRLLPASETFPENLLRFYLEFSAPMSRENGRDHIHLLDDQGKEVPNTFLNLDVEFWSADYRRYTVFLDPGRVKRGILPNDTFGRALTPGRRFSISVDSAWRDANGKPLSASFTYTFTATPADLAPIKLADWRITAPPPGTRTPLVIAFPKPLDHGILQRAIGVTRTGGETVSGEVVVEPDARAWSFRPAEPWRAGSYELVVLSILEDVCGNRIGRPFDIDTFEQIDRSAEPEQHRLPFLIK
jgi:hypothetical protein